MSRRTQVGFLAALVGVTCLVQAIAIWRSSVPALDAVRFVGTARAIDPSGFLEVLREPTDPPLFPLLTWSFHRTLVGLLGEFRESWALSVQIAAALPLALMPLPLFLMAHRLVGPWAAALGTTLVVCLPELAGLGAEGLSDSTYLLALSTALALLVVHLQPIRSADTTVWPVLLAGAATALAATARWEALVLAAALALVLSLRAVGRFGVPWRSASAYLAGLVLILGPWGVASAIAARGTATETAAATSATHDSRSPSVLSFRADADWLGTEPPSFAPKDPTTSIRHRGPAGAAFQLLEEIPRTFAYFPGILVLVGFQVLGRRPTSDADCLLKVYCTLFLAVVAVHTAREGYLSARHLLPLAVAGTACLGVGSQAAAECAARALGRASAPSAPRWAAVLVLATAAICTSVNLRPHHPNRSGHRAAARWLADNGRRDDRVVDTLGWTGLYSGLVTVPYGRSRHEWSSSDLRYLVVESRELQYDSRRSRTLLGLMKQAGTLVASFPTRSAEGRDPSTVLVYRWNAER